MRNKVTLVFGTRSEAKKMCPLVNVLKTRIEDFEVAVPVTGQRREMLQQVLDVFCVVPDCNLIIMRPDQVLFDVTRDVLVRMESVLKEERPDVVLVHGDTTTSFAAVLASFYLQVSVGHVEAGLRIRDIHSPWPEEFNRQAVDVISSWYFASTAVSKENLISESKPDSQIWATGNTGIDALRATARVDYSAPELEWAKGSRLILITARRRENLGEPMHHKFRAARRVMERHLKTNAICPIHMNPRVREAAHAELDGFNRLRIVEPLDVLDFYNFMAHSYLVLTDSDGIQEETPSLGKLMLVMRDTTERPEGVTAGTLEFVGTNEEDICRELTRLLSDERKYAAMSQAPNSYGDGHAGERIADVLAGGGHE